MYDKLIEFTSYNNWIKHYVLIFAWHLFSINYAQYIQQNTYKLETRGQRVIIAHGQRLRLEAKDSNVWWGLRLGTKSEDRRWEKNHTKSEMRDEPLTLHDSSIGHVPTQGLTSKLHSHQLKSQTFFFLKL